MSIIRWAVPKKREEVEFRDGTLKKKLSDADGNPVKGKDGRALKKQSLHKRHYINQWVSGAPGLKAKISANVYGSILAVNSALVNWGWGMGGTHGVNTGLGLQAFASLVAVRLMANGVNSTKELLEAETLAALERSVEDGTLDLNQLQLPSEESRKKKTILWSAASLASAAAFAFLYTKTGSFQQIGMMAHEHVAQTLGAVRTGTGLAALECAGMAGFQIVETRGDKVARDFIAENGKSPLEDVADDNLGFDAIDLTEAEAAAS